MVISIKKSGIVILAVIVLAAAGIWARPTDAPKASGDNIKPKVSCASLVGFKIPASSIGLPTGGATILSATVRPAMTPAGRPADAVPEYCDVTGAIAPVDPKAPNINFQLALPTVWNGKSWHIGGNQNDGFIPLLAALARDNAGSPLGPVLPPDAPFPIAQGYALYGGDSGHCCAPRPGRRGPGLKGGPPANNDQVGNIPANFGAATPDWAMNDEANMNYAGAHVKKTHDAAMAVIVQLYGVRPRFNYFGGESHGGYESLTAATRYPEDYDGVVASVPAVQITALRFGAARRLTAEAAPGGWIPPSKIPAIANEVRRQCDALDGLEDGVINNYVACIRVFDPEKHPDAFAKIRCAGGKDTGDDCLSDPQIATVNAFHASTKFPFALDVNGENYAAGNPPGGEDGKEQYSGHWLVAAKQPDAASVEAASGQLRQLLHDPKLNITDIDFAAHKDAILAASNLYDVRADFSKFFAKGGKVIIHSSSSDTVQNARLEMEFFEAVVKKNGRKDVDRSLRYYVTPQGDHSSAGFAYGTGEVLPRQSDLLGYLENWVERGMAPPEPIVETYKDIDPPYTLRRSRPLCRYPDYPRYNGKGDPKVAASYTCSAP